MPHDLTLIFTFTGGLAAALIFGYITTRLGLSPIVGYLLAGIAVSGHTPGFRADEGLAGQMAEIGVILLMFGVGLQFHVKELLAVRRIAIPGALAQIAVATALGAVTTHAFGWNWAAGIVFGLAISVASTVVLVRVLSDHGALHTRTGHIAIGWLVVEDIFTVVALVVLPALAGGSAGLAGQAHAAAGDGLLVSLGMAVGKLALLIALVFLLGSYVIPRILGYVARTGSRELFMLAILVLALGVAVGAAKLFGASMALGAFLAGMVVGQSEFSNRAASEALPFRDAFAVLFFVSVGMLFEPARLVTDWPVILAATAVIIVGKSAAALVVVRVLRYPFPVAIGVAVALAQIGEFSFILASLGRDLNILPENALNILVSAAILSITLNPLLYKATPALCRRVAASPRLNRWLNPPQADAASPVEVDDDDHRAIVVGYGPVGRTVKRILSRNGIRPVIIEMNLDTVRALRAAGADAVYGEAGKRETLLAAGIEKAEVLVLTASSMAHTDEAIRLARELNPDIRVLARANYLNEAIALDRAGAHRIVSAEGEVALTMTEFVLRNLGANFDHITRERERVRKELFGD